MTESDYIHVSPCRCGYPADGVIANAIYLGAISLDYDSGMVIEGVKCRGCGEIRQKLEMFEPSVLPFLRVVHPDAREIRGGKVTKEWTGELKPKTLRGEG